MSGTILEQSGLSTMRSQLELAQGNKSCSYIRNTTLQRIEVHMDQTRLKIVAVLKVGADFSLFKISLDCCYGALVQEINIEAHQLWIQRSV